MRIQQKREVIAALLKAGRPDLAMQFIQADKMSVEEAIKILDLDKKDLGNASALKTAYRQAAVKHHPDKGGDPEVMKKVNQAYDLLQQAGPRVSSPDPSDKKQRYKDAAKLVLDTLERTLKIQEFTEYFEKTTGKKFKVKHAAKEVPSGTSVKVDAEWTSEDGLTAFELSVWVDLLDLVWKKQLGGGDPDFSFNLSISTTIFHENRKSKFKPRDWHWTNHHKVLIDPNELFPADKIAKMVKGKEKERKFSRRDVFLALEKRLGARTEKNWAHIPIGEDFVFSLWRSTMMKFAGWSPNVNLNQKHRSVSKGIKMTTLYETEDMIDGLVDLQKKAKGMTDPDQVVNLINHELHEINQKQRAELSKQTASVQPVLSTKMRHFWINRQTKKISEVGDHLSSLAENPKQFNLGEKEKKDVADVREYNQLPDGVKKAVAENWMRVNTYSNRANFIGKSPLSDHDLVLAQTFFQHYPKANRVDLTGWKMTPPYFEIRYEDLLAANTLKDLTRQGFSMNAKREIISVLLKQNRLDLANVMAHVVISDFDMKHFWINRKTGKTFAVKDHLQSIREDPNKFGLPGSKVKSSKYSEYGNLPKELQSIVSENWMRVSTTPGIVNFVGKAPSTDYDLQLGQKFLSHYPKVKIINLSSGQPGFPWYNAQYNDFLSADHLRDLA